MKVLTKRQQEILAFIEAFISKAKYPPTIREISAHFGISVRGAYDHLKALKKKGVINIDSNRSRSIGIVGDSPSDENSLPLRHVPLLGTVAAGVPILSTENYNGSVSVPAKFLRSNHEYFALEVRGDSMINAGILEGDIAIIRHQRQAENGQIVVAMLEEAVTLKKFFKEQQRVKLVAENPEYPPIYTRNVSILGTLAHLVRKYE